jgi:hypothetical protein
MRIIKLIFKTLCPTCIKLHTEVVFEGQEEDFDAISDEGSFYITRFKCCKPILADSYELWVDNKLVREGEIRKTFETE